MAEEKEKGPEAQLAAEVRKLAIGDASDSPSASAPGPARECHAEQLTLIARLEAEVEELRPSPPDRDAAPSQAFLAKALELLDQWLQIYALDKMEVLIAEIEAACMCADDRTKVKILQTKSFMKWKQYKFREALDLMRQMEPYIGPSAFHYENIAHTHNSLGEFDEAERYFKLALSHGHSHPAGVLLGLATLNRRLKRPAVASEFAEKALAAFREAADGQDSSLVAKALTTMARCHEDADDLPAAEESWRGAVKLFKVTTGAQSPLSASSLAGLGSSLLAQGKIDAAPDVLRQALEATALSDICHLPSLCAILVNVRTLHMERRPFSAREVAQYEPGMAAAVAAVDRTAQGDSDDAAVLFKYVGELLLLMGKRGEAHPLLLRSHKHLLTVTSTDVSSLIIQLEELLPYSAGRDHA